MCEVVCPQGVLRVAGKTVEIIDRDGCMECGACAVNCPADAIVVTPGVGCSVYIIQKWIKGKNSPACGSAPCC
jgi:ferredoxin